MALKVLIIPDKFKGTLTARAAAAAIARGWRQARPGDVLESLPMSDGGDGFGEVMSKLLGAKMRVIRTVDAAHRPCRTQWWWAPESKTAIIESARTVGLAMFSPKEVHPFDLDTYGLGAVVRAAAEQGARHWLIGVGGSATNDGGFGMARALGWEFLDGEGGVIPNWTRLEALDEIRPPRAAPTELEPFSGGKRPPSPRPSPPGRGSLVSIVAKASPSSDSFPGGSNPSPLAEERVGVRAQPFSNFIVKAEDMIVAVDVENLLLGARGCTRIYGPQKGLVPEDFPLADRNLRRLAAVAKKHWGRDFASEAGAGAAGGLGFGFSCFLGARLQPGFGLFARQAALERGLRFADLVITGEGAIDASTLMGKGVGQVAHRCAELKIPCLGLGGVVTAARGRAQDSFTLRRGLNELTTLEDAKSRPAFWLEQLARAVARDWRG